MASNRPTRSALTALPLLALVLFASAFVVALGQTGAAGQSGTVTVDVGALPVGTVKTVTLTVHALGDARSRVFVVADRPGHVLALIGRTSNASGCAMSWSRTPGYPRMGYSYYDAFEDPCGGSIYTLDGACLDGPCTRDLDALPATRNGTRVSIDIDTLVAGRRGMLAR